LKTFTLTLIEVDIYSEGTSEDYGTYWTSCLCGSLAQCALNLKRLSAGPGFNPQLGWINCLRITGVHALRLISRTGKRVWR